MITINHETWYIKFVGYNHFELQRSDGSYSVATCDDNQKTIFIANGLRGAFLKKVLCHELTHAAMFSYNVELNLAQEEILADIIATYGEEIISITNKVFEKLKGR